ncbi:hypothetical protein ZWY2020_024711 [Hordeum vulgare]|nr:hypothetical protein ZWY2020_024711 [Hordeum vulgare]
MDRHREDFKRLDEFSPRSSVQSEAGGRSSLRFSMPGFGYDWLRKSSGRLKSLRQPNPSGAPKTAFAEDLKSFKKNIFDPQQKFLLRMNRFFFLSCIFAVAVDPLFFFLPIIDNSNCIVFHSSDGPDVLATKDALVWVVLCQYIPRTAGVFIETAWAGAGYYLLWFMLAGHNVGTLWYFLTIEREDSCWRVNCDPAAGCNTNYFTLGQGFVTSTYPWEVLFYCNMHPRTDSVCTPHRPTFNQLLYALKRCVVKKRDAEQWMHHRSLPPEIRERVRRYERYRWLETRGVDEENLVQTLPKDLRRDIKRHLCLGLVKRVPLFENMDERLLDAICERLRPALYTENEYILREGDPVDEMQFILHGSLESVTTDGVKRVLSGDELLTWALDPKSANFPVSPRTVKALARRLHSRQVQHTFRFYSQQWRTWGACFIQAAWRRYYKRKMAEQRRREEEAANRQSSSSSGPSLGATIHWPRFKRQRASGVHRFGARPLPHCESAKPRS